MGETSAEIPNVLLLHGNDEFAMAAHVERLIAGLGDPSVAGLNVARFDGRSGLDFNAFNTAVNAVPFLAPRRLVVLAHPSSAFPDRESAKKLLAFLEAVQPFVTVVLEEHTELKRDHWLLKWVTRHASTESAEGGIRAGSHVYNLPNRKEMPRWIEVQAKKEGGKFEPDAAADLAEMVGEDTRMASLEITKLLTYVNYARPVRLHDVEQVSAHTAQANIFEMVDALGQNNIPKAQKVYHQLLDSNEAFELWGMVIRQFRLLLLAREMLDEHASVLMIQKELGLHEYVVQKIYTQARRFSLPALERIYHRLLEIDEAAKTSQMPLDLALDTFIVESSQGM
jgi:DNA polymerase-3 subunit delta